MISACFALCRTIDLEKYTKITDKKRKNNNYPKNRPFFIGMEGPESFGEMASFLDISPVLCSRGQFSDCKDLGFPLVVPGAGSWSN